MLPFDKFLWSQSCLRAGLLYYSSGRGFNIRRLYSTGILFHPEAVYIIARSGGASMKRLVVLLSLLTAAVVSIVFAQPQTQQRPPAALEIEKLKDNLYMITGGGGN